MLPSVYTDVRSITNTHIRIYIICVYYIYINILMTSSQFTGNGWWKAGGSQEGCHFDPDSESKITALLGAVLNRLEVGYVLHG